MKIVEEMKMHTKTDELRALLHAAPERSWEEHETQRIIFDFLQSVVGEDRRFTITKPYKTALLISYKNGGDAPFYLFRADMDGLPVVENSSNRLQSKNSGMMHACGHDIHMTILARLIEKVKNSGIAGNFLFLFQPAEEGAGGAKQLLDAAVFDDYTIGGACALHATDDYPVGTIASNDSIFMAVPKEIDLIFRGKSSHAAMPQKGNDAIAAAVDCLSSIHFQLARKMEPVQLFLFHSGKILGGTARNIVADECLIEATARALSAQHIEKGMAIIEDAVNASAEKFGCHGAVEMRGEYIETVNTPQMYELLEAAAKSAEMPLQKVFPTMTGEDFGYFSKKFSGVMFWLGTGEDERKFAPLHAANYCPSSDAIPYGVAILFAMMQQLTG